MILFNFALHFIKGSMKKLLIVLLSFSFNSFIRPDDER